MALLYTLGLTCIVYSKLYITIACNCDSMSLLTVLIAVSYNGVVSVKLYMQSFADCILQNWGVPQI